MNAQISLLDMVKILINYEKQKALQLKDMMHDSHEQLLELAFTPKEERKSSAINLLPREHISSAD